ncbi:MAG TPA: hypothetical protein H9987_04565 [Candidatus Luteococcus avicola]|nr:hypothetical protein [Candidatus Luteococcus avicola]
MTGWELTAARAAVIALLGLLAVLGGSPIVRSTFRLVDRATTREVNQAAADPASPDLPSVKSVERATRKLRGGIWIGRLERIAIYAGLVAHYPEAIAISLALKGLARYPELKAPSPGAAEGFIIGTFVSVLWACACAGLGLWFAGLL